MACADGLLALGKRSVPCARHAISLSDICVSCTVFNHVQGKIDLVFDDLGELEVKNIPKAVQIFKVLLGSPATDGWHQTG